MNEKCKLLWIIIAISFTCVFVSCSDSGDEPSTGSGNGSAAITINGKTVKFSYCSYSMYDYGYCDIIFTNYDPNKMAEIKPKNISQLVISVRSDADNVPTGSFSPADDYYLSLIVNADYTKDPPTFDYDCESLRSTSGQLTISRNGDVYAITIQEIGLIGLSDSEQDESKTQHYSTSFSYSGKLTRIRDNVWD